MRRIEKRGARVAIVRARHVVGLMLLLWVGALACSSSSSEGEGDDADAAGTSEVAWTPSEVNGENDAASGDVLADTSDGAGDLDAADGETFVDPEPFEYPCEPGQVETCVTACGSVGSHQCLKDWGPCVPPAEFCGNCVDDDCDGLVNEDCGGIALCDPIVEPECPVAVITIAETGGVLTGTVLHLSAAASSAMGGAIVTWAWSVEAPSGSTAQFAPSSAVEAPSFQTQVAGTHLFSLEVWDEVGVKSFGRSVWNAWKARATEG